jgi:uncharacterized protein YutE (UPF0331/DUF86 family)
MMDKSVINSRIMKLREYTTILKEIRKEKLEEFMKNPRIYGSAERFLHLAIECCIDIANHIISIKSEKTPESYSEIFQILTELLSIDEDFSKKLTDMIKFRNLLTHSYLKIQHKDIYEILQINLDDFDKFIELVLNYLNTVNK